MSSATRPVVASSLPVSSPSAPSVAGTTGRGSSPPGWRRDAPGSPATGALAVSLIIRDATQVRGSTTTPLRSAGQIRRPDLPRWASRVGHREDVEGLVELLLGEL